MLYIFYLIGDYTGICIDKNLLSFTLAISALDALFISQEWKKNKGKNNFDNVNIWMLLRIFLVTQINKRGINGERWNHQKGVIITFIEVKS